MSVRWGFGLGAGALILLSLALIPWLALQPQDAAWARVVNDGVVVIATDASYPPFSAVDPDGNLFGFDVDLARALAAKLGARAGRPVQVQFENLTYDALLPALVAGREDVVISAFVPQPERTQEIWFSDAYFVAGTVAVAGRGQGPTTTDLAGWQRWAAGKRLAVEYGAGGDVLARQWARQTAGIAVLPRPTAEAALAAVAQGAAEAALVDALSAYAFLRGRTDLEISGPPLDPEPYVLAVNARNMQLAGALAQALKDLQADGSLTALTRQWLGEAAGGK